MQKIVCVCVVCMHAKGVCECDCVCGGRAAEKSVCETECVCVCETVCVVRERVGGRMFACVREGACECV